MTELFRASDGLRPCRVKQLKLVLFSVNESVLQMFSQTVLCVGGKKNQTLKSLEMIDCKMCTINVM